MADVACPGFRFAGIACGIKKTERADLGLIVAEEDVPAAAVFTRNRVRAAPVILSSLTEVEERSLALEVRAFGKPGKRHLLWRMPDTRIQLAVRAVLLLLLVLAIAARLTGTLPGLI